MIRSITLEGFKSFLHRELVLNQLTLLTGLNSSGKSSIIQALLILQKALNKEKSILLQGHGNEKDLKNKSYKGDINLSIEIDDKEFKLSIPTGSDYTVEGEGFPDLWYISAHRFGPRTSIPIFNEQNLKNGIGPNGENVLQCIRYYDVENPLVLSESIKHPASASLGLVENIKNWLSVISPNVLFDYDVNEASDTSYSLFDGHRSTNVGFGLSYVLPVITTLLVASQSADNLVIIENPEAHLHPRGQTELAKLTFLCAMLGTQVIVETHSEHVLYGIRLAVRNAKKNNNVEFAEKTSIHWFELDEHRNTEVTSPSIDNSGRIDEWPEGFFDQFEINSSKLFD